MYSTKTFKKNQSRYLTILTVLNNKFHPFNCYVVSLGALVLMLMAPVQIIAILNKIFQMLKKIPVQAVDDLVVKKNL